MKKLMLIALGVVFTASLIGCETIRGVGKDIQNTGANIGKAVNKVTNPSGSGGSS